MPFKVAKSDQCPADKPHAVMKEGETKPMSCHPTKADADKKMAAMKAKEPMMSETNSRPPRDGLFRAVYSDVGVRSSDNGDEGDNIGGPTLFGHFARFDEWTEIDSIFEGRFMERFSPGSFSKTIEENGSSMRVLFQHGRDSQVGDKPVGSIDELREDDDGAYYEVGLFDGLPDLLLSGLRAGEYGASFRFSVVREDLEKEPERSDHNPDGIPERTVKEARVMEFGPVTFPAYPNATAGVRSTTDEFFIQRLATQPERLRRLIEWLDEDPQDRKDSNPPDAEETHLEREQDQQDTIIDEYIAPSDNDAEAEPHLVEERRGPKGASSLALPPSRKPRGVLPTHEEDTGWNPIRLP